MELTIAVASACIAAAIAVYQFVLPNALALILTGVLSEEQPAVTWSVASRFFLSSDWPVFLRSEAATASGVPKKVALVTWTKPLGLFLIAIAAVVTPLGLYDAIGPVSSPNLVQFTYVPDESLIGLGTLARSHRGYSFSRLCSGYVCPGDRDMGNVSIPVIVNSTTNETELDSYRIVSNTISPSLINLFESGSEQSSTSLAGYFDIEARRWTTYTDFYVENNATLLEADFQYSSSVLMDNKLELVEGLIVDAENGGIGFRNHSVPVVSSQYGVEWEEDILWMQPETSCVDTNITAMFTGKSGDSGDADLVDRGGFCNIQRIDPYYHASNTTTNYAFEDAQKDPKLYERAYYLAWYTNALVMLYLNISDPNTNRSRISSAMNQHFKANGTFTDVSAYSTTNSYWRLARGLNPITIPGSYSWNATTGRYMYDSNPSIPNPHNVTADMLQQVEDYCGGGLLGDQVNISMIDTGVGFIAGPASMINQTDPNNATSQTWDRPYYSCASATRISIKTVRFRYNSTREAALKHLEIINIKDKTYNNPSDKPIWGLETPLWGNTKTPWNLSDIESLWGLLSSSSARDPRVTSLQSDHFYLPASFMTSFPGSWVPPSTYRSYTPGTTGASMAWNIIYNTPSTTDPYSGSDPRLQGFFKDMTKNITATSKLLNLMWTDTAANAMIGTRGAHTARFQPLQTQDKRKRDDDDDSDARLINLPTGQYPVYALERHIRYRWIYGIPAFICFSILATVVMLAFVSMICGRGTVAKLRWYMFHTNSGRLLAAWVYPETMAQRSTETRDWLDHVGRRNVLLASGADVGYATELQPIPGKGGPEYVKVQQREEIESVSSTVRLTRRQ